MGFFSYMKSGESTNRWMHFSSNTYFDLRGHSLETKSYICVWQSRWRNTVFQFSLIKFRINWSREKLFLWSTLYLTKLLSKKKSVELWYFCEIFSCLQGYPKQLFFTGCPTNRNNRIDRLLTDFRLLFGSTAPLPLRKWSDTNQWKKIIVQCYHLFDLENVISK